MTARVSGDVVGRSTTPIASSLKLFAATASPRRLATMLRSTRMRAPSSVRRSSPATR
jgi:hypothetical protein